MVNFARLVATLACGASLIVPVARAMEMTISPSLNPILSRDTLTVTAYATGASGYPTGTVTFYMGATQVCTAVPFGLSQYGQPIARCDIARPQDGDVSAWYSGDAQNAPIYRSYRQYVSSTIFHPSITLTGFPGDGYINFDALITPTEFPFIDFATLQHYALGGTLTYYRDGVAIPGCTGRAVNQDYPLHQQCFFLDTRPGLHTYTVEYTGDVNYAPASATMRASIARPPKFDFNADGHGDVLWKSTTGRTALWLLYNAAQIGGRELFGAGTGWMPKLTGDFNHDGFTDILFEHADGSVAIWLMNGDKQIGGAKLLAAGTGWTATHVADFDGDGRSDILWQHVDGRIAIWLMNGTAMAGGGVILAGGTGWSAKLTADYNGDGKADILFEHTDQSSALWLMDGARQAGGGRLFGGGTGWLPFASLDLDADGKDDIVWKHTDGRVAVWTMNGSVQVGGALATSPGAGYVPVTAAYVKDPGRGAIVWRHGDGTTVAMQMAGSATAPTPLVLLESGSGWTLSHFMPYAPGESSANFLAVHADGRVALARWVSALPTLYQLLPAGTGYTPIVTPQ